MEWKIATRLSFLFSSCQNDARRSIFGSLSELSLQVLSGNPSNITQRLRADMWKLMQDMQAKCMLGDLKHQQNPRNWWRDCIKSDPNNSTHSKCRNDEGKKNMGQNAESRSETVTLLTFDEWKSSQVVDISWVSELIPWNIWRRWGPETSVGGGGILVVPVFFQLRFHWNVVFVNG